MSNYTQAQIEEIKRKEKERREAQRQEALRNNQQVRRAWADEGAKMASIREINQMIASPTVKI